MTESWADAREGAVMVAESSQHKSIRVQSHIPIALLVVTGDEGEVHRHNVLPFKVLGPVTGTRLIRGSGDFGAVTESTERLDVQGRRYHSRPSRRPGGAPEWVREDDEVFHEDPLGDAITTADALRLVARPGAVLEWVTCDRPGGPEYIGSQPDRLYLPARRAGWAFNRGL